MDLEKLIKHIPTPPNQWRAMEISEFLAFIDCEDLIEDIKSFSNIFKI